VKSEKDPYNKLRVTAQNFNPLYILVILSLPLFFINIHGFTDWGDDFALYLHQAKNIAEGISPQKTHLIYNTDNPIMISGVSVCFSLLLVPFYLLWGLNFKAFSVLTTFFLILAGVSVFYFLKKFMPEWLSMLLVLLLLYHRWTLDFKQHVLSDIPFVAIFYCILYLFYKNQRKKVFDAIFLGMFTAFMMNVRSIGIAFVGAVAMELFFCCYLKLRNKITSAQFKLNFIFNSIIIVFALLFSFIIKKIAFPEPSPGGYINFFSENSILDVLHKNVINYYLWFKWFFTFKKIAMVVQYAIFYIFLVLMLTGLIKKLWKKPDIIDYCFFLYIAMLVIYPATPGFRYIFPMMPIMLFYFYNGTKHLSDIINRPWLKLHYFIPVLMLLLYYPGIWWHIENREHPIGTEQRSAEDIFDYIKNNTPPDARIVFRKPRALSLYTNRSAMANYMKEENPARLDYLYHKYKIDYLLLNTDEIPDSALIRYLNAYPDHYRLVYQNDKFRMFGRMNGE